MRIIAGRLRGRRIKSPPRETTRPTKDRIREAVFNIIAEKIPGAKVLDIFSGSGAYGLEALSRGAHEAVFVEKDASSSRVISDNAASLDLGELSEVITDDAFKALKMLGVRGRRFDLVFSDPPFGSGKAKKTLIMVNRYDILNPSGLLVIERRREESVPEGEGSVSILKQKTYGNIIISVFSRK